jgi:hypothetical protein
VRGAQVIDLSKQQEVTKAQEAKTEEAKAQAAAQQYAIVRSPVTALAFYPRREGSLCSRIVTAVAFYCRREGTLCSRREDALCSLV